LTGYRPEDDSLGTYGEGDNSKRLDWVLISKPLVFARYEVLPDVLSDHRAVVADIVLHTGPLAAAGKRRHARASRAHTHARSGGDS
jgi:hypothetical protein